MVKTKGSREDDGTSGGARPSDTQPTPIVCCMCGDHGIPTELFKCKICKFRSQHNNLYLKLETYIACNWCLASTHESAGKKKSGDTPLDHAGKSKKNPDEKMDHKGLRELRTHKKKVNLEIKVKKSVVDHDGMKKVHGSSPEESPVSTSQKRIVGGGGVMVEDKKMKKNNVLLRKSKSENHLGDGGGIKIRPVFKHRVRRYKLLEEIQANVLN